MTTLDSYLQQTLEELQARQLFRQPRVVERMRGAFVTVEGKEYLCFCSNDYLGLAQHPKLREAASRAMEEWGVWGSGASRLLSGTTVWHERLEQALARFRRVEAVLYFSAGYMANVGLLTALADEKTLIVADKLDHASLIDACLSSKATARFYPHKDVSRAAELLKEHGAKFVRRLIITDTMFSMDGDLAPLQELAQVARDFEAELVVDDAHGFGVLGETGRGALEHFGLEDVVHVSTANLSKAAGSAGGFVAGSRALIQFLQNRARPFIFTTAYPAAVCAAGVAAVELLAGEEGKTRRAKVWELTRFLRKGLTELGFNIGGSLPVPEARQTGETPILPLWMGETERALEVAQFLWERGIFAPAIRPPTVPPGQARIRLSVTALHEREHLARLLELLSEVKKRWF